MYFRCEVVKMNKHRFDLDFLNLVIDKIEDPVFVKDEDHKWVLVNNSFANLIGQQREDLIGKSDYDFLKKEDSDVYWEMDDKVFQTGELNVNLEEMSFPDGTIKYLKTKKTLFYNRDNKRYLVGVVSDLTNEKKITDELIQSRAKEQEANEAKSKFLANMSHEIRTPLHSIIGFTDLLLREETAPSSKEYVKAIKESALLLQGIIDEVLDFSKIEAGKLVLNKSIFSLRNSLKEVENTFVPLTRKRGNHFIIQVSEEIAEFYLGDRTKLHQVINNLVSNANKFTKNGRVELFLDLLKEEHDSQRIKIIVKDTGTGISKEFLPQLFESFTQQDLTNKKNYSGTGLGLSIVKSYLELMGSEIQVNTEEGVGSEFFFEIDLGIPVESSESYKAEDIDFGNLGNLKVLVAEDNEMNQSLIKKVLDFDNIELTLVENGREALEQAVVNTYDVMLLDMQMPEMDGFEAVARIKELPNNKNTPIIAITANVLQEEVNRIYALGIDYVSKPINLGKLFTTISRLLN